MRSTILKTSPWLCTLLSVALLGGQTTPQRPAHTRPGQGTPGSRDVASDSLRPAATGGLPARGAASVPSAVSVAAGLSTRDFPPGPGMRVDAKASRHAISPDVYGINGYTLGAPSMVYDLRLPVTRWGGDASSQFNWQSQTTNSGSDWYFENIMTSIAGSTVTFEQFHQMNLKAGAKSVGTIPIMGWVANPNAQYPCGFDTKKYTNQKTGPDPSAPHGSWTEPYNHLDCGSGVDTNGKDILNEPTDTDMKVDPAFMQRWVAKEVSVFGSAAQGGIAIWELDNEPVWWSAVHRNIHPNGSTFDEVTKAGIDYAQAVKAADPTAAVAGPITAGWGDLFFSNVDFYSGWNSRSPTPGGADWKYWNNPVDRKAHADLDFAAYYLQQFAAYEKQNGKRLLDYFDIHGYMPGTNPQTASYKDDVSDAGNAMRLQSTRLFWDPNFVPFLTPPLSQELSAKGSSVWDEYLLNTNPQWKTPGCVCLIPRMKDWVAKNYPGTKLAITEYNLGDLNNNDKNNPQTPESLMNGALAQADLLGVFGREGLDLATLWGNVLENDPASFAFKLFRNYDGQGSAFGETSISAISDNQDQLSMYAAERSDSALTLLVINKTSGNLSTNITLGNFQPDKTVQVWRYSNANPAAIVRQQLDQSTTVNGVGANFPAYSATLLIVPQAPSDMSAHKPVISALVNAATNAIGIAPGTLIKIIGTNLGPASGAADPIAGKSGLLGTNLSEVRVLFNGTPAPVLSASSATILAMVPYTAVLDPTSNVQVEYRNSRSDPYQIQVVPAAPGIFTANATGQGPALAFSFDSGLFILALNSELNPASDGSSLLFYMTGAGVLDPPGVDGRIESAILPQPTQSVSVTIGGKPATIHAASAPGSVSGIVLVNVTVPTGVPAGNAKLVVTVGTTSSPDGVTLAVK